VAPLAGGPFNRTYTTSRDAHALRPATLTTTYPLYIEKADLDAGKAALLAGNRVGSGSGKHLQDLATWIDTEVRAAVGSAPTGPMLLPF